METHYKISKFITYLQYIVSPLVVFVFLYYIYSVFTGEVLSKEELFFIPIWFWACIFVVVNLFKLRYIEVRQNNILVKSPFGNKTIEYSDIQWINQNIFGSNWYIIAIKYKNNLLGKSKTIIVFPEMYTLKENFTLFGELNVTKYIREQIIKSNKSYSIQNEPSRWYLTKIIFGSLVPFLIFSFLINI